jgi:hypothetical protein
VYSLLSGVWKIVIDISGDLKRDMFVFGSVDSRDFGDKIGFLEDSEGVFIQEEGSSLSESHLIELAPPML